MSITLNESPFEDDDWERFLNAGPPERYGDDEDFPELEDWGEEYPFTDDEEWR